MRDRLTALLQAWQTGDETTIDVGDADRLLEGLATDPPEIIAQLGMHAGEFLERQPDKAVNITTRLGGSIKPATRCLCAAMIMHLGKFSPGLWTDFLKHLAQDDDWDVRNFAASVFDSLPDRPGWIEFHEQFVWETLNSWVRDTSYLVRRVPTRALLGYARQNPAALPKLFALWDPLLTDPNEYVRRNLVSALRMVGRKQPDAVLKWINTKLNSPTGHTAEITKMVLDSGFAERNPELTQALEAKLNPTKE